MAIVRSVSDVRVLCARGILFGSAIKGVRAVPDCHLVAGQIGLMFPSDGASSCSEVIFVRARSLHLEIR